ncbi:hypothetical protein [Acidianus sp. HS-5]|uniref:hypothetical protein n=1 Tax=Acidianus sp. HS-5 TaxID=2886040 RepID=UPI001F48AF73|nr:hypothetical protein [Acidianus sp. HS-5]BDC18491.1 hypothetical protein HS5_13810 [Acidianus sp. HS-5]
MYILTKIGLIMLIIGIALAGIGIYEFYSLVTQIEPIIELHGAQRVILEPYQNYTITVSPYPSEILAFAYNSTSPINTTVPPAFVKSSSPSTTENVYLATSGDISGIIELHNPSNSSVEVYYLLSHIKISTIDFYSIIFIMIGILAFIVGIIVAIIGVVIGRRKRT